MGRLVPIPFSKRLSTLIRTGTVVRSRLDGLLIAEKLIVISYNIYRDIKWPISLPIATTLTPKAIYTCEYFAPFQSERKKNRQTRF